MEKVSARYLFRRCMPLIVMAASAAEAATSPHASPPVPQIVEPTPMFLSICGLILLVLATVRHKRT